MLGDVWVRLPLSEEDMGLLEREFPGVTFHTGFEVDPAEQARTEVVFTSDLVSDDLVAAMPMLRWVQVTRGGGASYVTPSMRERSIRVTTCTGIHGASFSEFTFATILTLTKQLPQMMEAQRAHRWAADMGLGKLEGSTLGVVGLGTIGSAVAQKAKAFGMRVMATRLRPEYKPDYVDWIAGPDGTLELLAESDYVVVARPPGGDRRPWITMKELGLMRPNRHPGRPRRGRLYRRPRRVGRCAPRRRHRRGGHQYLAIRTATGGFAGVGLSQHDCQPRACRERPGQVGPAAERLHRQPAPLSRWPRAAQRVRGYLLLASRSTFTGQ